MTARRGVALVLVLWIVVVLASVAATVALSGRRAVEVATNARARSAARYAAESGVEVAAAALAQALATEPDAGARRAALEALLRASADGAPQSLGDARFQVALVDASARLDLNLAGEEALAALFAQLGAPEAGRPAARAIQRWLGAEGVRAGVGDQAAAPARRRAFASLDDLARVPGVSSALARAAAPFLTVDGDGRVSRAAAPPVRAAARGELTDGPTRLLVVSRGWLAGSSLTHEIQAVYAVDGARLAFVRWRERDL